MEGSDRLHGKRERAHDRQESASLALNAPQSRARLGCMRSASMRIASLSLIAALAAGPALADDEPMSTAGATQAAPPAASSDTAAQIEQWIADSPAAPPEP